MSSLCQHVAPEVPERISSDVVIVIVIAEICEIDKLVYYDFQPLL